MVLASPFACRFNTDFQPTEEERKHILQTISVLLEEQSHLDALIRDLTIQRDQLQQHIESHQQLVPPIRRAPVEILQEIFYHCLPSHHAVANSKEAPLLLGRVCSAWRQISRSTPQLWSALHISNPDIYSYPPSDTDWQSVYCEAVEAWLNRSSDLPLSISFANKWGCSTPPDALFAVLVRFSPRWKHLAIKLPNYRCLDDIKEVDAPMLTTVTMDIEEGPSLGDLEPFSFLQTSSLRSVYFTYTSSFFTPLLIQWKNITNLSVGSPLDPLLFTLPEAFGTLRMCSNLITCKLNVSTDDPLDKTDHISISRLEVLRLGFYVSADSNLGGDYSSLISSFFDSLDMPNLSHLDFMATDQVMTTVPFKSILERQKTVDTLEYTISNVPVDELSRVLKLGSSVRRLRLTSQVPYGHEWTSPPGSALSDEFLTHLVYNSQCPALPALEEIDIQINSNSDVLEETLLKFILSRTDRTPAEIARLKRVHFTFARPQRIDIMPDLCISIERGLQVQISYPVAASPYHIPRISPMGDIRLAAQPDEHDRGFWDSKI